jgi:hypothetical protein
MALRSNLTLRSKQHSKIQKAVFVLIFVLAMASISWLLVS